jgi:hypothetical protein
MFGVTCHKQVGAHISGSDDERVALFIFIYFIGRVTSHFIHVCSCVAKNISKLHVTLLFII